MISDLVQQLIRDEGLRLKPYTDSVGKLTIGVGRNLTDKGISNDEAEKMLENDIEDARRAVFQMIPWVSKLDEVRRAVLVNMAFNMGIGGLMAFKNTLAFIEKGQYPNAAAEMLNSKWADQVGPRAHRLALQLTTGTWQ